MNDILIIRFFDRSNHRQISHYDYTTTEADISVAEEAVYHNTYDMSYNLPGDSGYHQPTETPYGGWTTFNRQLLPGENPGQQISGGSFSGSGTTAVRPSTTYGVPNRPGTRYGVEGPPKRISVHTNTDHSKNYNKDIDWQKIGTLALFKLGLAKLKAFGFLKVMFLLVFKLKLFLIAIFFKFLMLLKLMKFFKIFMFPLLTLPVLPLLASLLSPMILSSIFSLPSQFLSLFMRPTQSSSSSGSSGSVTIPTPTISGGVGGSVGLPSIPTGNPSSATSSTHGAKFDDYTLNRRRIESLDVLDPSLAVFRSILDSEKCLERIACRMATAEKAGVMPFWINW